MSQFVVIQDGWLPEPFESLEEAKAHRDRLELEATRAETPSRIAIYRVIAAMMLLIEILHKWDVDEIIDALT